jgi:hypothetical protein
LKQLAMANFVDTFMNHYWGEVVRNMPSKFDMDQSAVKKEDISGGLHGGLIRPK